MTMSAVYAVLMVPLAVESKTAIIVQLLVEAVMSAVCVGLIVQ